MTARIISFPAFALPRAPGRRGAVRAWIAAMWQAHRTRRLLAEADAHTLADIGLSRGDAMMEAARPCWELDARNYR